MEEAVCYRPLLCSFHLCGLLLSYIGMYYTISDSGIVYKSCLLVMRVMMLLLSLLIWMRIWRSEALLSHCNMIIIVSGYTFFGKSYMENPKPRE